MDGKFVDDIIATMGNDRKKVSVWLDNEKSDELKKFRCTTCGKIVFEYYSDLKIIIPGEMEEAKKSPIVVQCHGSMEEWKGGTQVKTHCTAKYWIE